MWRNEHKRRVKAKGVARSGAYQVEERGQVGRKAPAISARSFLAGDATEVDLRAFSDVRAPGPVSRLADMSPEKRAEMERLYGFDLGVKRSRVDVRYVTKVGKR